MKTRGSRTQKELMLAFTEETEENDDVVRRESFECETGCTCF